MSTASRIRKARRDAGLSQAELAGLMHVTRSACSQWEREGGTAPRGYRLERLAMILRVSVEWLATGEGGATGLVGTADTTPAYRRALSDDERELLVAYERLGKDGRRALLVLLQLTKARKC